MATIDVNLDKQRLRWMTAETDIDFIRQMPHPKRMLASAQLLSGSHRKVQASAWCPAKPVRKGVAMRMRLTLNWQGLGCGFLWIGVMWYYKPRYSILSIAALICSLFTEIVRYFWTRFATCIFVSLLKNMFENFEGYSIKTILENILLFTPKILIPGWNILVFTVTDNFSIVFILQKLATHLW